MYSKFIKFVVLLSLLVCCGFAGRVLYGRFLTRVVQGKDSRHIFCVRSGIISPWSLSPYITQTQRRNTLMLGNVFSYGLRLTHCSFHVGSLHASMCFFRCISLARVFILRVTEFSLSSYRSSSTSWWWILLF